jgi:hypothetical protein
VAGTGPLEILVVGFGGQGLPDGVGDAVQRIQDSGDVRVVEAFLITKTATGAVRSEEATDLIGLADVLGEAPDSRHGSFWMDQDSLTEVAGSMERDSTALALVLVHRTARDVVTAFRDVGAAVLVSTRLPPSPRVTS